MAARSRVNVKTAGGRIAGTSITGSYQNVLSSVPGRGLVLVIANSCNQELVVSLDGGTTDWMYFPPGYSPNIDLAANDAEYSGTVSVKHNGVAPASGVFSVGVIRCE
ncbi:MAG: hypothetical protein BWY21_00374 [Parcubacteria group bacterium ADurb.Bin216]|nr:MAG: hypothetical protein BWY21_00374 [Parcubacteria group bacterium ADurb.Bin216]